MNLTITHDELFAPIQAGTAPDYESHAENGRAHRYYWYLPGHDSDYSGCRPTAKLVIQYDKQAGEFSATVELTNFALHAHGTREAFSVGVRLIEVCVLFETVARFNAARFAAFTAEAFDLAHQPR